jgi:hypothetical protein
MMFEIIISIVMPYPSLYGVTYTEGANPFCIDKVFYSNDLLLCFMMFFRVHFVLRGLL